ncbi:MAG: helicase-associated domain-containing protein [Motilibacteraceae bacterium]
MSTRSPQPATQPTPPEPQASEAPRSLADDLRARSDAELEALLRARPDLLTPVPADVGQLAVRAATQTSTGRALDRLDRWLLQVLDVVAALPEPTTAADVERWLGADPRPALATLREQGLLWGPEQELRLVRTARQLLPTPAGLGPALREVLGTYAPSRIATLLADAGLPPHGDPAAGADALAAHLTDAAVIDRLVADAAAHEDARTRDVLDRLTWGTPFGSVTPRTELLDVAHAEAPVDWLIARGLLVITSLTQVALPREIAVHLRGGRLHRQLEPEPPALEGTERAEADVDHAAGGAAFEIVRLVEDVLEHWSTEPPPVLRAGGLGVRDLRRLAQRLDVEEWHAALVVELAYVAGLLAASGEVDEEWWPTPAYDTWLGRETAERWALLAEGWLLTTRVAGAVGSRDEKDKVVAALGHDIDRAPAPEIRAGLLGALAETPGLAATPDTLQARLDWARPRRYGRLRALMVPWTLREAELLGVTGRGALSGPGRALLEQGPGTAAALLAPLLPRPLDHVLLQADLTAVAPGPLETPLAQELALLADVESKGGATVYRFTESSVRRALDAGRSADEVHQLLGRVSRTPVPQPLSYLVDDVARRHGRVRVGTASAYVRADDEALLAEIVADRRSAQLRLRRLAPTVLAAQAPADTVLERLRAMGYAPAAETPEGDVVVRRPDARRTPPRQRPPRLHGEPPAPKQTLLSAAVKALRAGDKVAATPRRPAEGSAPGTLPRSTPADTLAAVQSAIAADESLWIGYVNGDGQASQRVIDPISLDGGHVSAFDHLRGEVRTFALHRITGVAFVDEDADDDDVEAQDRRDAEQEHEQSSPRPRRTYPPYYRRRR